MKLGKYLLLALSALSLNAYALEKDKESHFAGTTVLSFASYSLLKDTEYPVLYSVGVVTAMGVAMEWHDKNTGHGFSKGDLAADFVGALTGAYLGKGFYYVNKQIVYKKTF